MATLLQEQPVSLSAVQRMSSSSVVVPRSADQGLIEEFQYCVAFHPQIYSFQKPSEHLAAKKHGQRIGQKWTDLDGRFYLTHKLVGVPPRISVCVWINYFLSTPDDLPIHIQKDKSPIFFINEIWLWINLPCPFFQSSCSPPHNQRLHASSFAWKDDSLWYWMITQCCPSGISGMIFFNSGPSCFAIRASNWVIASKKTLFQYSTTSSCSWPSI